MKSVDVSAGSRGTPAAIAAASRRSQHSTIALRGVPRPSADRWASASAVIAVATSSSTSKSINVGGRRRRDQRNFGRCRHAYRRNTANRIATHTKKTTSRPTPMAGGTFHGSDSTVAVDTTESGAVVVTGAAGLRKSEPSVNFTLPAVATATNNTATTVPVNAASTARRSTAEGYYHGPTGRSEHGEQGVARQHVRSRGTHVAGDLGV